jgi:hypothetical protein
MMKRVIAVALAAGAVAGCASHSGYKPPAAKLLRPASTSPSAALTAPVPASGLSWFMVNEEGKAKLAYGAANSDDVRLMLTCAKGSGKLTVSRMVAADQAGATPILTLGSGSARGRWLAKAEPATDQAGRTQLVVDMTTTEPAIDAFERNGWVSAINADGKVEGMAPQPGDTAVHRFFDYCG